jgi:hypothetical protein
LELRGYRTDTIFQFTRTFFFGITLFDCEPSDPDDPLPQLPPTLQYHHHQHQQAATGGVQLGVSKTCHLNIILLFHKVFNVFIIISNKKQYAVSTV